MIQEVFRNGEDAMRKSYPSDISRDVFEEKVLPIVQQARKKTKPVTVDLSEVFNGIRHYRKQKI